MKLKELFFNAILSFLLFSIVFFVFCSTVFGSFLKGIILGISAGIFFSFFISTFVLIAACKMKKFKKSFQLDTKIWYDGGANHIVGKECVGGWIFLTEDELLFHPHSFNKNTENCKIAYSQIKNITIGSKIRSIDVYLHTGGKESFIVNNRKQWIMRIKKLQ